RVNGTLSMAGGSRIDASAKGYAGGSYSSPLNGASFCGGTNDESSFSPPCSFAIGSMSSAGGGGGGAAGMGGKDSLSNAFGGNNTNNAGCGMMLPLAFGGGGGAGKNTGSSDGGRGGGAVFVAAEHYLGDATPHPVFQ